MVLTKICEFSVGNSLSFPMTLKPVKNQLDVFPKISCTFNWHFWKPVCRPECSSDSCPEAASMPWVCHFGVFPLQDWENHIQPWTKSANILNVQRLQYMWWLRSKYLVLVTNMIVWQRTSHQLVQNNSCEETHCKYIKCKWVILLIYKCRSWKSWKFW